MSPATSVIKYKLYDTAFDLQYYTFSLILWYVISLRGVFYSPPSLCSGSACTDKEPRIRDPLLGIILTH